MLGKPSALRLHALALPPLCPSVHAWPYAPAAAALPGSITTSDGCSGCGGHTPAPAPAAPAPPDTSNSCSSTGSAAPAGAPPLVAGRAESPTTTATTLPAVKTASGGVAVEVGDRLGVRELERVPLGEGVLVGVPLGLRVCEGVLLRVPLGVLVWLGVGVAEGVMDDDAPNDSVAVALVVGVRDGVGLVGAVTLQDRLYAPLPKLAPS